MQLVLDTSYIVAAFNERDKHHSKVQGLQQEIDAGTWQPILTDSVLLETANVLLGRRAPDFALRVAKHLSMSSDIKFVTVGSRMPEAMRQFQVHAKDGLGLTDCTIVAVAKEFRAKAVATFDSDFGAVRGLRLVPES